jgi:acetylornithine deacetylase/succinyl-diaminopimelate desuccinylase-like protein
MDSIQIAGHVLDLAQKIQQIPAPTFAEAERSAFMHACFQSEGLRDVSQDELGNVYARLPGTGASRPLVISAHIDTVFPLGTRLDARHEPGQIFAPGIGDNSLGAAGLVGLVWALRQRWGVLKPDEGQTPRLPLPGDIWLVANVGEEGLGNLGGMRAVVDRFGGGTRAYLILEGMALGQVYHRALGVQRYRITVRTPGGHSWVDYGRPSAIHELAELITSLTAIPVPRRPRTSLNVGVISGGTTVNTIAAEASLDLDLRSEGSRALDNLVERVEELVESACQADVQVTAEIIGRRPAGKISANHPLVRVARRALESVGLQPNLGIGSTDANIPLSRGLPAVCLGLSTGGGAHTLNEYINTRPVSQGLDQLVAVIEGVFREIF